MSDLTHEMRSWLAKQPAGEFSYPGIRMETIWRGFAAYQQQRIEELEQRLKDTEFLYRAYFVLATEKGIKPGSRELIDAAARFEDVLEAAQTTPSLATGRAADDFYEEADTDNCDWCGGEGYCEVDDPINDDCDEFGFGECRHCDGTGVVRPPTAWEGSQ